MEPVSCQRFWWVAAMMPSGMPKPKEINKVTMVSIMVRGGRSINGRHNVNVGGPGSAQVAVQEHVTQIFTQTNQVRVIQAKFFGFGGNFSLGGRAAQDDLLPGCPGRRASG